MNNYFNYKNISISDGSKEPIYYHNTIDNCIEECSKSLNCHGLNISPPICNKNMTADQCLQNIQYVCDPNQFPNNCDLLKKDTAPFDYKCSVLNRVNNYNTIIPSKNLSIIKNEYVNDAHKLNSNEPYYLSINNNYLTVNEIDNINRVTTTKNKNKADTFIIKPHKIINKKNNECLELNGDNFITNNCKDNYKPQSFILENKFNSIRSGANNDECLSLDKNNNIINKQCNNERLNINQKINLDDTIGYNNQKKKIDSINLDNNLDKNLSINTSNNNIILPSTITPSSITPSSITPSKSISSCNYKQNNSLIDNFYKNYPTRTLTDNLDYNLNNNLNYSNTLDNSKITMKDNFYNLNDEPFMNSDSTYMSAINIMVFAIIILLIWFLIIKNNYIQNNFKK